MATTNYGWPTPVVGGSGGVWGTILNSTLEEIDTDLKTIDDRTSDMFRCRVKLDAAVSPVVSTETALSWDAESFDSDTMHDLVTNPSRVTVPTVTGTVPVLIAFALHWSGGADPDGIIVRVRKNGTTTLLAVHTPTETADTIGNASATGSIIDEAVSGDYYELTYYTASGTILGETGALPSPGGTTLSVARLLG